MLLAEWARFEAGFAGHWHDHPQAQLIYPERGVMVLHTRQGQWVTPPLQACWLPSGEGHRVETSRGFDMVSVYCSGSLLRRLPSRPAVIAVSALLREVIRAIPSANSLGRARRLAMVFADELQPQDAPVLFIPQLSGPLLPIEAALLAAPGDDRTLEAWAAEVGVSARTLTREFERRAGITFGAYRRQTRLKSALVRLAEGQPATRVGLDLGFGTASNFIRAFRAATGLTPGKYVALAASNQGRLKGRAAVD